MTLRLGFCGVGRWGTKLATAFRACGAEIVAHDRGSAPIPSGGQYLECFGLRMPWRDQLAAESIDAIIAVAPPEVTTQVALACAEAGKPVMATKPLFDHPKSIRAPFYVDFWRLWANAHLETTDLRSYSLYGSGPFRDFPGSFDYGPHIVAAILDKFKHDDVCVTYVKDAKTLKAHADGELFRVDFTCGSGHESARHVVATMFGNAAKKSARVIWGQEETPEYIGNQLKAEILQRFCQSFLNDVSEGFVDTRLLELSRRGMEELRRIREMAK